jgi:hypothetical protein
MTMVASAPVSSVAAEGACPPCVAPAASCAEAGVTPSITIKASGAAPPSATLRIVDVLITSSSFLEPVSPAVRSIDRRPGRLLMEEPKSNCKAAIHVLRRFLETVAQSQHVSVPSASMNLVFYATKRDVGLLR